MSKVTNESAVIKEVVLIAQDSEDKIRLMVVGMPNVGKSSLINALRRNYMKKGDLVSTINSEFDCPF